MRPCTESPPHSGGPTLAEGIAVKTCGAHTLPMIRELVQDVVLVSERAIEEAVFCLASVQKTIAEGAGAAGLAAVLSNRARFAGRRVGLFQSGANIDPRVLASILMRGLERESKIVSLRISLADRPGMLGEIATELWPLRREHSGGPSQQPVPGRAGQGRRGRYCNRDEGPRPRRGYAGEPAQAGLRGREGEQSRRGGLRPDRVECFQGFGKKEAPHPVPLPRGERERPHNRRDLLPLPRGRGLG